MPAKITGLDQYSGSGRVVTISRHGTHVLIEVEGSQGGGECLLTPGQAHALGQGLIRQSELAASAGEMTGDFDQ
jgi:hypothetical protein